MKRTLLGDQHPDVADGQNNLAWVLQARGDHAAAEPLYRASLAMKRRLLGDAHPGVAQGLNNLASLLVARGDPQGCARAIDEALAIYRAVLPAGHWRTRNAESVRGACLVGLGRHAEAEPLLLESYPVLEAERGADSVYARDALRRIVELYQAWGRPEKAEAYRILMAD